MYKTLDVCKFEMNSPALTLANREPQYMSFKVKRSNGKKELEFNHWAQKIKEQILDIKASINPCKKRASIPLLEGVYILNLRV